MYKMMMLCLAFVLAISLLASYAMGADRIIKMSTTTSTQASGLLDVLLPIFEKETGIAVKVIAKGTGAAIRDGRDGNVDVIFVHAKEREEEFVRQGYGTRRYPVMHNDFVIVGPKDDPAGIGGMKNAARAFSKIAASRAPFISRGDDSGTHTKEQKIWKSTGLALEGRTKTIVKKGKERQVGFLYPVGAARWYVSIGQGMGRALMFADEKHAYTLADRGTYIKYTVGSDLPIALEILCQGDPQLANPYGVIPVNPQKHPHVNYRDAAVFAEWLVSKQGQTVIRDYKLLDKQLFYPDAL